MGAPKQKWTSEEESALKAGVIKHGAGKWRTILKDQEFSNILSLRSNVDLKDKWRNLSVVANGFGSREKSRVSLKKTQSYQKHDDNPLALATIEEDFDDEIVDAKPLAMSTESLEIAGPKKAFSRLDNLILEAITTLKEPTGSNKTAILMYIEDNYWPPPDLKHMLSAKLKSLNASGRLIKVKRKYRIAPSFGFLDGRNSSSKTMVLGGRPKELTRSERDDVKLLSKSQIDSELARLRNMTAEEAAEIAAQAVAEAEAKMAEAEEAAREAEAAEADAETARAFAEAAMLTLKNRSSANMIIRT